MTHAYRPAADIPDAELQAELWDLFYRPTPVPPAVTWANIGDVRTRITPLARAHGPLPTSPGRETTPQVSRPASAPAPPTDAPAGGTGNQTTGAGVPAYDPPVGPARPRLGRARRAGRHALRWLGWTVAVAVALAVAFLLAVAALAGIAWLFIAYVP